MRTKHVVVEKYQTAWVDSFKEIQGYLRTLIPSRFPIVHVGSTSVVGLSAKPIIDVDILYETTREFEVLLAHLAKLGYSCEGELGIPFRYAFSYQDLPLMKHHLYLVKKDSKPHLDHVYFRDYLGAHKDAREIYGALKESLAKKYPYDIDSYVSGKEDLIEETLANAYRWSRGKNSNLL